MPKHKPRFPHTHYQPSVEEQYEAAKSFSDVVTIVLLGIFFVFALFTCQMYKSMPVPEKGDAGYQKFQAQLQSAPSPQDYRKFSPVRQQMMQDRIAEPLRFSK